MSKFLVLLPLLLAFGFGQNLLTNGDFEQPLTTGWTTSSSGAVTIDRQTGLRPVPGYQARDSLYGYGAGKLSQIVDVPGTHAVLTFWASFNIGQPGSCWPVSCVAASYYDASGTWLGETRFYLHTASCTWTPTSTMNLIDVTTTNWTQYTLDIASEVSQHLPGVNPDLVSKVGVALFDTTSGG